MPQSGRSPSRPCTALRGGVIGRTVLEACRTSERIVAYRQIRLSTFGRLQHPPVSRSSPLFHWYEWAVPVADVLYDEYLDELKREGLI